MQLAGDDHSDYCLQHFQHSRFDPVTCTLISLLRLVTVCRLEPRTWLMRLQCRSQPSQGVAPGPCALAPPRSVRRQHHGLR